MRLSTRLEMYTEESSIDRKHQCRHVNLGEVNIDFVLATNPADTSPIDDWKG